MACAFQNVSLNYGSSLFRESMVARSQMFSCKFFSHVTVLHLIILSDEELCMSGDLLANSAHAFYLS